MAKLIPTLLGVFAITAAAIGVGLLMQPSSEPATAVSFSTTTNDDATTAATTTGREAGEDVSGPCDEAEHANDPRCTGGVDTDDDHGDNDRSGRGRGGGDDGGGDEDRGGDDDRSGSNSGRG
jgi:hypothetical protein